MTTCKECEFFFTIPEDADDYEKLKGDCITEKEDEKGKYWLTKPVFELNQCCGAFHTRQSA